MKATRKTISPATVPAHKWQPAWNFEIEIGRMRASFAVSRITGKTGTVLELDRLEPDEVRDLITSGQLSNAIADRHILAFVCARQDEQHLREYVLMLALNGVICRVFLDLIQAMDWIEAQLRRDFPVCYFPRPQLLFPPTLGSQVGSSA